MVLRRNTLSSIRDSKLRPTLKTVNTKGKLEVLKKKI